MTDLIFYWHIHHGVLVEPLIEPIENRVAYIKEYKPEHERELRLRLLRKVQGKLPDEVIESWNAYNKAKVTYNKAWNAYYKTLDANYEAKVVYRQALHDHKDEIEALHTIECPNCPWDGETILPVTESEE